jgi:ribonuclease Z
MRHLLPLIAGAAALTQQGYQRQRVVRSATRLPQEPAELDDWLKPYAGADDFRAERQQQLAETASDLEITFLGTASCVPSVTRGVSCTALRYDGATYLFDAGEATQVQAQRTTLVKPGKVEAIFVTHLHGDHTFGLPGLLCLCGQDRDASDQPIEIFGPEGLRAYVRASLQLTQSRVAAPHVIHELVGVPNRPPPGFRARAASFIVAFALGAARRRREAGRHRRDALTTRKNAGPPRGPFVSPKATGQSEAAFGEVFEGRNIPRDADGAWTCETRSKALTVRAAPMAHTVPCVGFVVVEPDRPGALDVDKVAPILERNIEALKAKGIKEPRRLYRVIKEMGADQQFTFPDGAVIRRDDVVGPDKRGRVLVFCGDTADASSLLPLLPARGADVVVHEATNCRVEPFDNDVTEEEVERSSVSHGHSTPQLAGRFAALAGAERLVLNHFSPRYKGDASPAALAVMAKIEDAARSAFDGEVVAAWDLLNLPVAAKDEASAASASADAARLEAGADAADAFRRGEIAPQPPRKKAPPRLKKKPQPGAPSKASTKVR